MDGFINFLKPPGMTSHDAVNFIRKTLKIKKVGHTGTLDPGAAGVLPICLGKATRLAEYITNRPKSYRAEITFGISTDSQDTYGNIESTAECKGLRFEHFLEILPEFTGNIEQVPPMVSAVRMAGTRLYELARKGIVIERKPKIISIYKITVFKKDWKLPYPKVVFDVTCSKGTYVRTLCHEIGNRLGVGAHMSYLIRTQSGSFSIDQAFCLEEITRFVENNQMSFVRPLQEGIIFIPSITVDESQSHAVLHGNSITLPGNHFRENHLYRVEDQEKRLLAVGQVVYRENGVPLFRPEKVLAN